MKHGLISEKWVSVRLCPHAGVCLGTQIEGGEDVCVTVNLVSSHTKEKHFCPAEFPARFNFIPDMDDTVALPRVSD